MSEIDFSTAVARFDDILADLKDMECDVMMSGKYPMTSSNIEFLEHFIAQLSKTKCPGCGKDFGEEK